MVILRDFPCNNALFGIVWVGVISWPLFKKTRKGHHHWTSMRSSLSGRCLKPRNLSKCTAQKPKTHGWPLKGKEFSSNQILQGLYIYIWVILVCVCVCLHPNLVSKTILSTKRSSPKWFLSHPKSFTSASYGHFSINTNQLGIYEFPCQTGGQPFKNTLGGNFSSYLPGEPKNPTGFQPHVFFPPRFISWIVNFTSWSDEVMNAMAAWLLFTVNVSEQLKRKWKTASWRPFPSRQRQLV